MDGYAVGVKLAFASNAEEMLGLIAGKMMGVHLKAGELKQDFGLIKDAVGGAFAIGGALAMLGVMEKLIHKGAELEDAMYRIQTAGFTPKQLAQVRVNATKVAGQFTNLTETELIKLTGETTAVYGDPAVAMKNLPTVAAYMSAVKFRHPEDAEGAARDRGRRHLQVASFTGVQRSRPGPRANQDGSCGHPEGAGSLRRSVRSEHHLPVLEVCPPFRPLHVQPLPLRAGHGGCSRDGRL